MFDLAEKLRGVSNINTREQIEYLPFELLDPDPDNFYSIDGINELADSIATVGLVHPLRVRQNGERYTITSGHRRRAAIQLLIDSGEDWSGGVPCVVDRGENEPEFEELKLIFANRQRQKTSAELSREAEKTEKLLCALKEKGFEFPGRMQNHVAQAMGVKAAKLKRLHAIRSNAEKNVLAAYDAGEINESVAYEFSKIPIFAQQLFIKARERACMQLDVLTADEVREYYELYCKLRDLRCKAGGCNCPWSGERIEEALRQMNGYHGADDDGKPIGYGNCTKGKCCLGCKELLNCPAVRCRFTEPEVKQREAAEAEHTEKAAQEHEKKQAAFDRARQQAAETNAEIWARFRKSAEYSGVDLDEVLKGYCDGREAWYECLRYAKGLQPDYNNYAIDFLEDEWKNLSEDLHCSIDFLFGRTSEPGVNRGTEAKPQSGRPQGSPLQEPGEIVPTWIPGAPKALGRYMCLLRGNADRPEEPDKDFRVDVREDGPYLFNRPMLPGYIITAHWPLPPLGEHMKEA